MGKHANRRVGQLEHELATLRAGASTRLRRQLRTEVRTDRLIIGDEHGLHTEATAGRVHVNDRSTHTRASLQADRVSATVDVAAETLGQPRDGQYVCLLATHEQEYEPGGAASFISINGSDVAVGGRAVPLAGAERVTASHSRRDAASTAFVGGQAATDPVGDTVDLLGQGVSETLGAHRTTRADPTGHRRREPAIVATVDREPQPLIQPTASGQLPPVHGSIASTASATRFQQRPAAAQPPHRLRLTHTGVPGDPRHRPDRLPLAADMRPHPARRHLEHRLAATQHPAGHLQLTPAGTLRPYAPRAPAAAVVAGHRAVLAPLRRRRPGTPHVHRSTTAHPVEPLDHQTDTLTRRRRLERLPDAARYAFCRHPAEQYIPWFAQPFSSPPEPHQADRLARRLTAHRTEPRRRPERLVPHTAHVGASTPTSSHARRAPGRERDQCQKPAGSNT